MNDDYKKKLSDCLIDRKKWPFFDRPDFLEQLIGFANTVYKKKTTEGYLASLLGIRVFWHA